MSSAGDDADFVEEADVLEVVDLEGIGEEEEEEEEEDGADGVGAAMAEESMADAPIEADAPKVPTGPDVSFLQFRGHTDSVYCIAVSPDGRLAVSGGGDDVALLWNLESGALLHRLEGHSDSVVAVAFSPGGTFVATGSYDHAVKVWSVSSGALLHSLDGPDGEIEWVAWHSKGDVLLAGSADSTAWMWEVTAKSASCMQVFAGHEAEVTCGMFTGSGKAVVTASTDCTLKIWNPKTGASAHAFSGHGWHHEPINTLACSIDKPLVLTGAQDGTARLVNIAAQKVLATIRHLPVQTADDEDTGVSVESVAFCESESHPYLATGATDGSLIVWDIASSTVRHRMMHEESVTRVAWLPALPLVAATTADGNVYVWDARDGRRVAALTGHAGIILDARVFSAGGGGVASIVTAGDDHVCRVYRLLP